MQVSAVFLQRELSLFRLCPSSSVLIGRLTSLGVRFWRSVGLGNAQTRAL